MPAIAEILIQRPAESVWKKFTDPSTHVLWLGNNTLTEYENGELIAGSRFWRTNKDTGEKFEGEILSVKEPSFLQIRVDLPDNCFATTEYHLVALGKQSVIRVLLEICDTGETTHAFFPEILEEAWKGHLCRLKDLCERT